MTGLIPLALSAALPAKKPTSSWAQPSPKPDAPHPSWLKHSGIPVNIVAGAPGSGKSTFVEGKAGKNDLVIDLDEIMGKLSGAPVHSKKAFSTLQRALAARNQMLAQLSTPNASKQWDRAWLIVTEPVAAGRSWWRKTLGEGTTYVIATPPDEIHRRIDGDASRKDILRHTSDAIKEWWSKYKPAPGDVVVNESTK